jgi:hypothetical protein
MTGLPWINLVLVAKRPGVALLDTLGALTRTDRSPEPTQTLADMEESAEVDLLHLVLELDRENDLRPDHHAK